MQIAVVVLRCGENTEQLRMTLLILLIPWPGAVLILQCNTVILILGEKLITADNDIFTDNVLGLLTRCHWRRVVEKCR